MAVFLEGRERMDRRDERRWRCWARTRVAALAALAAVAMLIGLAGVIPSAAAGPPPPSFGGTGDGSCHHLVWTGPGRTPCPGPPTSPVHLVTTSPTGSFVSGQIVTVTVGPNPWLRPGSRVYIQECAAPAGVPTTWSRQCDPRTVQHFRVVVGRHGTVSAPGYPIFALPDATTLGEPASGTPVCNLTHPCALLISEVRCSPGSPHLWFPFSVALAGGGGPDPGNGLPDVPYAVILPVLALIVFAVAYGLRRRRTSVA